MSNSNILPPNTKAEILEAYNRLKLLTEQNKNTIDQPNRAQVSAALEEIENILSQKTAELEQLEKQVGDLKEQRSLGKRLLLTQETLQFLQETFTQEEADWERRKKNLEDELAQKTATMKRRLAKEFEPKKTVYQYKDNQKEKAVNGDSNNNAMRPRNEIFSSKHAMDIKEALMNTSKKD